MNASFWLSGDHTGENICRVALLTSSVGDPPPAGTVQMPWSELPSVA